MRDDATPMRDDSTVTRDDAARWEKAHDLFQAALEHPAAERRAFLESLTDDADLRAQVLSLLASHEGEGAFDRLAGALAGDGPRPAAHDLPDRIGPYRVLRVIGEGGMGVVHEAEQREPVHRRVAIKRMKVGLDTREVVGRFEAERQALAMMDHPGIAKVFDAGATDDGRPYFVMELVRGIQLDQFCTVRRLTTRQRVELFIQICTAVQHAHLKGVIHRDLKPGNVLVAEDGDRPLARVIDFGIAKAVSQPLTDRTLVTTVGQTLGTLTYMSPEQADSQGLDVDTRTDVYALGVILYELLIDEVPVDPRELGAARFLARLVQLDWMPPTPSRKLAALSAGARTARARARRTELRSLRAELRGDLQWIVMKAMDKDRERRYLAASALADDLRRFLRDEPVSAHPPGAVYRVGKFVRRNRAAVAVATIAIVALATSIVSTVRSRDRALESERVALTEASRAEAANDFLVELLGSADPTEDGRDVRVADMLDRASTLAPERFAGSAVAEASVRLALGTTYEGLGLYESAERELRRAAELYRGLDDPALADALVELGSLLVAMGDFPEARAVQEEALDVRIRAHGARSAETAEAHAALGETSFFEGDFEAAAERFRTALSIYADSLPADAEPVVYANANLAAVLEELGQLEESLALNASALEGLRSLLGPDHVDVATVSGNYALKLQATGRLDEAEPFLLDALRILRLAYGADSDRTARALNNLGAYYRRVGRTEDAAASLSEALEINVRVLGPDHREVASNLLNLGNVRFDRGAYEEALGLFQRSLDINRRARPEHPVVAQVEGSVAWAMFHVDRTTEAVALLRGALERSVAALGPDHLQSAVIELRLGEGLRRLGRRDEAATLLPSARRRLADQLPADHDLVLQANEFIALHYEDAGRPDLAAAARAGRR